MRSICRQVLLERLLGLCVPECSGRKRCANTSGRFYLRSEVRIMCLRKHDVLAEPGVLSLQSLAWGARSWLGCKAIVLMMEFYTQHAPSQQTFTRGAQWRWRIYACEGTGLKKHVSTIAHVHTQPKANFRGLLPQVLLRTGGVNSTAYCMNEDHLSVTTLGRPSLKGLQQDMN